MPGTVYVVPEVVARAAMAAGRLDVFAPSPPLDASGPDSAANGLLQPWKRRRRRQLKGVEGSQLHNHRFAKWLPSWDTVLLGSMSDTSMSRREIPALAASPFSIRWLWQGHRTTKKRRELGLSGPGGVVSARVPPQPALEGLVCCKFRARIGSPDY